jgi:hypothetical protein
MLFCIGKYTTGLTACQVFLFSFFSYWLDLVFPVAPLRDGLETVHGESKLARVFVGKDAKLDATKLVHELRGVEVLERPNFGSFAAEQPEVLCPFDSESVASTVTAEVTGEYEGGWKVFYLHD